MATQMTQFMEAIANLNREQQELRAIVERPRVEVECPEFEDFSMGKLRPQLVVNLNINGHARD